MNRRLGGVAESAVRRLQSRICVACSVVVVAAVGLSPAGCSALRPGRERPIEVPQEKVRRVENLELKKAPSTAGATRTEPNAPPPEKLELTLEQCRAMALENNLDLKTELISPTLAAETLSQEQAKFESSFFANLSYTKSDTPSVSYLDAITGSSVDMTRMDAGVRVPLRTGGTLTFDLADSRTKTDAELTQFNPYYTSDMSVSISQPLLQNAGRWVSTYSIRIAGYEQKITDARTKLEVIRVLASVDRVYWRLYAARKQLEVRQQQHELALAQLAQARRFVDAGERAQVEIVRAEAGAAQQLEAIIVAENNLRDRQRELKLVVHQAGLDMRSPTIITTMTEPDPVKYDIDPEQLVRTAVESRMEMLELELQIAEDAETYRYMRNQALPAVTVDYTYNVNGLGAARSDAYDMLLDNNFADHRLGLQAVVPLGNEAAKSRVRQAFYQRRQRLATRDSRRAAIEQEVLNAVDQAEANWQRILAGRQNTILAARLFEAEKRQFELGLRTSTEVLDAQTKFADAQSSEIQALTEYQIALVDLAYATGTLLGAARVEWEPIVPDRTAD